MKHVLPGKGKILKRHRNEDMKINVQLIRNI